MQNQTSLQETTIKEETEGLGIEYTNYSPDYSLYQRDYVATGESEPVETGRSRYRIHIWCFLDKNFSNFSFKLELLMLEWTFFQESLAIFPLNLNY